MSICKPCVLVPHCVFRRLLLVALWTAVFFFFFKEPPFIKMNTGKEVTRLAGKIHGVPKPIIADINCGLLCEI